MYFGFSFLNLFNLKYTPSIYYSKHIGEKREYDEIIHKDNSNTDNRIYNPYLRSNSNNRKQYRELSSCRVYLRRGLTFFIDHFQQREREIKHRPILSIIHDPEVSPATYTPASTFTYRIDNEEGRFDRKFLKIAVENTGEEVAKNCKARLRILRPYPENTRIPSDEPKPLLWDSGSTTEDISPEDFAILYVVLADERDFLTKDNYFALVTTPHTINNLWNIRAQDGFGLGNFHVEVVVTPQTGESIRAIFRIQITANWRELSMIRVS